MAPKKDRTSKKGPKAEDLSETAPTSAAVLHPHTAALGNAGLLDLDAYFAIRVIKPRHQAGMRVFAQKRGKFDVRMILADWDRTFAAY